MEAVSIVFYCEKKGPSRKTSCPKQIRDWMSWRQVEETNKEAHLCMPNLVGLQLVQCVALDPGVRASLVCYNSWARNATCSVACERGARVKQMSK